MAVRLRWLRQEVHCRRQPRPPHKEHARHGGEEIITEAITAGMNSLAQLSNRSFLHI